MKDIVKIKRLVPAGVPNPNTGVVVENMDTMIQDFLSKHNHQVFIDSNSVVNSRDDIELNSVNLATCIGIILDFNEEYFMVDLTSYGEEFIGKNIDKYAIGVSMYIKKGNPAICERIAKFILYKIK